jgi:Tfp pilus assembly protein PilF
MSTRKQQLEEMLKEDPTDSFLRYGLAMEFVSEGNDAEAVQQFQTLLKTDLDYIPGYHQAGLALVRLGRTAEARQMLTAGIAAAERQGNMHAAEEMSGTLSGL